MPPGIYERKIKAKFEDRVCFWCGKIFSVNVRKVKNCCSTKCSAKRRFLDHPELIENHKNKMAIITSKPEYIDNQSKKQKQVYIDHPEKHEERSKQATEWCLENPDKCKERGRKLSQKYKDDPESTKNLSAGQKRRFQKPEEREKTREGNRRRYLDPEQHRLARERKLKYNSQHPEAIKRGKDHPNFNPNKPEFKVYGGESKFKFNFKDYLDKFDFAKVNDMYHPIKNKNGYVRDHMLSRYDGFKLKIDPKIISHPANCQLITALENSKKKEKSCITLEELLSRIMLWESENASVKNIVE